VSTSTVASPRAARPAPPPVRHGTSRWTVYIRTDGHAGGNHYSVRPMPDQPGFKGVWQLRKHHSDSAYIVAAPKSGDPGCTCPDHESRGSCCKHILALASIGLFRRPKAAWPKKAPAQARGLKAHAQNAHKAIGTDLAMRASFDREDGAARGGGARLKTIGA
jgi:SWIM zinc finger